MTHMIIDRPPRFCPNCGKGFAIMDKWAYNDWYAHASHTCLDCDTHWQYVETPNIIKTAQNAGGDMS